LEHEVRRTLDDDERAIGELVDWRVVEQVRARAGIDALRVELRVDRVCADLAGMELAPDRREPVVVLAAAERAGPMSGRQGGRLVEEEELGEAARLQERLAVPALE